MAYKKSNPKTVLGVSKAPMMSLVSSAGIIYESLAMRDGAKKYGPFNWRKNNVIASVYIDAIARHLACWMDGEENAPDSGVPHLGHAKASLGILIDALEGGQLVDDRPPSGPAPKVIDKFKR